MEACVETMTRVTFLLFVSIGVNCVIILATSENGERSDEFCQWESFNASCPNNAVILMTKALYGRMQTGRCMPRDYYIGCYSDLIAEADDRCSGRRRCTITVPDPQMHDLQQCPDDLGAYMEAQYTCIKVQSPTRESCHSSKPMRVERTSGYLASIVTMDTGYGSTRCPWKLQVAHGQRINITLLDFGTKKNLMQKDTTFCPVYAKIKESNEARETTVCGDTDREKRVFTSVGNELEISLEVTSTREFNQHFVFKYEAVGCATPVTPMGGWIQREADTIIIGCNKTTKKWHLVCQNTHWVGQYDNCTAGGTWNVLGQVFPNDTEFPFGLVVSVIIGVILGVLIGVTLLGLVLLFRRRSLRRSRANTMFTRPYGQSPLQEAGYGCNSATQKWVPGAHGAQYSSYAHIWEMKQTVGQTADYVSPPYVADPAGNIMSPREAFTGNPITRCQSQSRAKEHIYESPKFDRKSPSESNTDPPFYHEFDMDEQREGVGSQNPPSNRVAQRHNMDDSRYTT